MEFEYYKEHAIIRRNTADQLRTRLGGNPPDESLIYWSIGIFVPEFADTLFVVEPTRPDIDLDDPEYSNYRGEILWRAYRTTIDQIKRRRHEEA